MLNGILVKKGGHVGFVSGGNPRLPVYWAEERGFEFLENCLKKLMQIGQAPLSYSLALSFSPRAIAQPIKRSSISG